MCSESIGDFCKRVNTFTSKISFPEFLRGYSHDFLLYLFGISLKGRLTLDSSVYHYYGYYGQNDG